MEKKTFDGQEYEVYTMSDWNRDRTLGVKVGQAIDPDVFWQLCESMPPQKWSMGIFQPGEPYSHDFKTGNALYTTFKSLGGDYYRYEGLQP